MAKSDPKSGRESEEHFKARLRRIAMSLPRDMVRRTIARMRENIIALKDAKGFIPKSD